MENPAHKQRNLLNEKSYFSVHTTLKCKALLPGTMDAKKLRDSDYGLTQISFELE